MTYPPVLSDTGLAVPTLDELHEATADEMRTRLGDSINTTPSSVITQIIGIVAGQDNLAWENLQALVAQLDVDGVSGMLQDSLYRLIGLEREAAESSSVTLTLDLDAAITIPAGSLVSHDTTGVQFYIEEELISTDAGEYEAIARSVTLGPIEASAGTLTVIDSPITGWNTVTNAAQATLGQLEETDAEFRTRRTASFAIRGSGTLDSIVAAVTQVDNVTLVKGFENKSGSIDSESRPGHSFEIVVLDSAADDDEIAQAIFSRAPAGIESFSYSADEGTAVDADGNDQVIPFTRADSIPIYLEIDLTKNEDYPVDGDDQVAAAMQEFGELEYAIGTTLYATAFYAAAFSVAGVVDITDLQIDDAPSPFGTSFVLTDREFPTFDVTNIVVNSVDE